MGQNVLARLKYHTVIELWLLQACFCSGLKVYFELNQLLAASQSILQNQ